MDLNAAARGQSVREVKSVNWWQYGRIIDMDVSGQYIDFITYRFQDVKISIVYPIQPKNII